jgi:alpha-L-fucosidase
MKGNDMRIGIMKVSVLMFLVSLVAGMATGKEDKKDVNKTSPAQPAVSSKTVLARPPAGNALPAPTAGQYVWHEQERLMFLCLDPCTWQGRETDNHTTDLSDMKLPKLDTDQWCEAAKAWGAKEILFVAKHTGGFCWWQTDTTDYSVKSIPWKDGKGCLLEDLARSCREYGLSIGIYVYPGDETWGAGLGSGGRTKDPKKQDAYNKVFRQQVREAIRIARRHTKVTEVWFDGSCVIDVGDILKEEAPDAVVFQGTYASIRWVGTERGQLSYDRSWCTVNKNDLETGVATAFHSTPDGDMWAPCEVNTTLYNHHWFWSPAKETHRKGLGELMRVYYESVGQGTVMLLNATPTTEGLISEADMDLYRALGKEISRRFQTPLSETSGEGDELVLDLGEPRNVNHVVVIEDYRQGERIREYVVEGWNGKEWKAITRGAHVGRKHISFFDDTVLSKLRLNVTKSVGRPLIRRFAAYDVTEFKEPVLSHGKPYSAKPAELKKIAAARQAHWQVCGKWSASSFRDDILDLKLDLTGKITEAGQWQVKFEVDGDDAGPGFANAVLLQQGQASVKGMLAQSDENPMIWNINRTAVVTEGSQDIRLDIRLKGRASSGTVFVRRR